MCSIPYVTVFLYYARSGAQTGISKQLKLVCDSWLAQYFGKTATYINRKHK